MLNPILKYRVLFKKDLFYICILLVTAIQTDLIAQKSQLLYEKATKLHFNKPDSALAFFQELANWSSSRKSLDTLIIAKNRIAAIQYLKGNYIESMKGFKWTFEEASKMGFKKEVAYAENGIGLVHLGQLQYEQAISAFNIALQINSQLQDSANVNKNLFNIGICQRELGRLDEAIHTFDKALNFLVTQEKNYLFVMTLNQKAKALEEQEKFEEAKTLYEQVLSEKAILTNWEKTYALSGLAEIAFEQQNYTEALKLSQSAYLVAEELNALWDKHRAAKLVWTSYEALNEPRLALKAANDYILLSDSLFHREKDTQINAIQNEVSELKNRLLQANLENAQKQLRQTIWIIVGVSSILIILLVFLYSYKNSNQKIRALNAELYSKNNDLETKKRQLEKSNQAKNQIFSIISHDLRGPIRSIIQIMDMDAADEITQVEKDQLRDMLRSQVEKTRDMMDNLLNWANQQMDGITYQPDQIDLKKNLLEEIDKLEISLKAKKIKTDLHLNVQNPTVKVDPNHLSVILQNILSNAIKFTPTKGSIEFTISQVEGGLVLHIKDSGVGISPKMLKRIQKLSGKLPSEAGTSNEKGSGMGIFLASQLMSMNQIEMKVESALNEGSTFSLVFKST